MQEIDEEKSTAALIAVGKRMVLHHEIQQVGGLAFQARVSRLAEYALFQVAQQTRQAIAPLLGEQLGGFAPLDQIVLKAGQGCAGMLRAR